MTTENKRDLAADLAFADECQRTESGLTLWNGASYTVATEAIRRALAAEAEVERLQAEISFLRDQRESLETTLQHYRGYA